MFADVHPEPTWGNLNRQAMAITDDDQRTLLQLPRRPCWLIQWRSTFNPHAATAYHEVPFAELKPLGWRVCGYVIDHRNLDERIAGVIEALRLLSEVAPSVTVWTVH